MIEISVATDIEAPAESIWKVLTDLPRFSEWNPFIREASGTVEVGKQLFVSPRSSFGVRLVFRPTVLVCDKDRELRWRGQLITPLLGGGEHRFTLEPAGEGRTRLVQAEVFTGLLPRFLRLLLEYEARRGFRAMNEALKARVERARSAPGAASVAA